MIRKRAEHGIIAVVMTFLVMFIAVSFNYFRIAADNRYVSAARERSELTVVAGVSQGTIYDKNMVPLTNSARISRAVAVPSVLDREDTAQYAVDKPLFYEEFDKGKPFAFTCINATPEKQGLTVFEIPERYSDDQPAQHVIGYTSEGTGVSGIEYAYDAILRSDYGESSVTYSTDGFGRVLIGDGAKIVRSSAEKSGVVLTVDSDIQRICRRAGHSIEKGAVIVADVKNGDILGLESFPEYSVSELDKALSDERSPLINRALYSYSVGSIFKLVTSCTAIEENFSGYAYNCTGNINIDGKNFNCHRLDGHGLQNMSDAITNSCNTYFISLSRNFSVDLFRKKAYLLGFGRETYLCSGIIGSAGVLPTVRELLVPAELANFSFGQGRLTATPLQVTQLTCAIANGGEMPALRIIKGITVDGSAPENEKKPQISNVMDKETADILRDMMISAITDNDSSNANAENTSAGAKTSTAQTGRSDENGDEYCHAWITGFFPAEAPKYAVTVLVEDGGYGNDTAAPVFREIAEEITKTE